jgi:hypothetical protein
MTRARLPSQLFDQHHLATGRATSGRTQPEAERVALCAAALRQLLPKARAFVAHARVVDGVGISPRAGAGLGFKTEVRHAGAARRSFMTSEGVDHDTARRGVVTVDRAELVV